MDSLEWYSYSLLQLIISFAESVEKQTQLKTVSKQAALIAVPKHPDRANNETGPRHGGEISFLTF